jgi:hypothetical protein
MKTFWEHSVATAFLLIGVGLFLNVGCDRHKGTGEASSTEAKQEKHQALEEGARVQKEDAVKAQDQKSPFNLIGSVGRTFDVVDWGSRFGNATEWSSSKGEPNYTYRGGPNDGFWAVTVTTRGDKIAAIDVSFKATNQSRIDMLTGFSQRGVRKNRVLSPNLREVDMSFEEYAKEGSSIRILVGQHGPVRLIAWDTSVLSTDDVMPAANNLPAGLLDRARKTLERQRKRESTN